MAPSPPRPARRLIAYQPNDSSGEDMPNWGGNAQANRSFSPGRQCVPVVTPVRSYSASNLQQCELHPIPQSEHRGVSPEELYNSDRLDQLAQVSDPGSFAEFRPDFMSSRVLDDSNEADLPKRCRKHELLARLRHHH
ncbi:hypothetical protein J437_LFUL007231 [Ladona fulva]|uniref:Uncharacterized protein n=1 Tax=Ladona fulva TaxID=123851 RepID=A0A8K0K499_LADFU|nr:hypothetical protein J437_LFUL007231 [Ladona fulva]